MSRFLKSKRILSLFLVLIIVFSFSSSANDYNNDIAPLALPSITNYFYSTYESTADYYNNTIKGYFYYIDENDNLCSAPYYYDDGLQLRSNCYGYATRMFYELNSFPYENIIFEYQEENGNGTSVYAVYKQQPGEFADKTNGLFLCNLQGHMTHTLYNRTDLNNFLDNMFLYQNTSLYNSSISTKFNYIEQLVEADFAELGYTITEYTGTTIPSASSASGKRMIALAVGNTDFHFYMQHSDNTWSHKGGYGPTSNVCIDCKNALTNNTIRSHALEGIYSGGALKFYYITKNAIIDSSHAEGTFTFEDYGLDCVKTIVYPIEAGNDMYSCEDLFSVPVNSTRYNLDYIGDTDFFFFTVPSGSGGTYTITLSSVDGPRSFKISLYNSLTALIDTRVITLTEDSPSYSYNYNLTNGSYYYLKIEGNEDETLQEHICNRRYDISIIK